MATPYKLKNILQDFKTTLVNDSSIGATIYVGEDARNPLGEDEVPFVVMLPGEYQRGQTANIFAPTIMVEFAIKDSTISSNEFEGFYTADDTAENIFNALQNDSSYPVFQISYSIDPVTQFPIFTGGLQVQIEQPNTIGG